jgi:hypothetical protein
VSEDARERAYDPGNPSTFVKLFAKTMDARVKPAHDSLRNRAYRPEVGS